MYLINRPGNLISARHIIPLFAVLLCMICTLFFSSPMVAQAQRALDSSQLYEMGLKQKDAGNFQEALSIWDRAEKELSDADFRIAQSYIDLVTEEKLKDYYPKASALYHWGLTGNIESTEEEALLYEIELLKSLFSGREYRGMKRDVKNADVSVLEKLRSFWEALDPTPINDYNERLLEHWERVAHVREEFKKRASDELDDRALIYLKYGEPFYIKEGTLSYNSSLVNMLLNEGIQTPSFASVEVDAIVETQRYNLETQVRNLHVYPDYQVWIYRNLTDDPQNTIFIFSAHAGTNFKKVNSVDDFIPSEAYRISAQNNYSFSTPGSSLGRETNQSSQSSRNVALQSARESSNSVLPKVVITPALILQLMYYEQFAALDDYFGKSYYEMLDRFTSFQERISTQLAREFATVYGNKLIQIQSRAPEEKSEYEKDMMTLPSQNYAYRYLDESNTPYLKIYSVSNFEEALYYDLLKETNSLEVDISKRYVLVSGYLLQDEEGSEVAKEVKKQTINDFTATSVFSVPYESDSQLTVLSHELHKSDEMDDSTASADSPFPLSLKGLSTYEVEMPEPLMSNTLTASDFIIGYSSEGEGGDTDAQPGEEGIINFTISHEKVIPVNADVNLYYELYNLQQKGSGGIADFTFEYSIIRDEKGFLRGDKEPEISITVNNSVASGRYANVLSIDTSKLEKGDYKLDIRIVDKNSNATLTKTEEFSIR